MYSGSLFRNERLSMLFPLLILLLLASDVHSAQDIGYLSVESQPKGALIYLNGTYTNSMTSAWKLMEIGPGRHMIELARNGYKLYQDWITIERGKALEIHVELAKSDSETSAESTQRYVDNYLTARSEPSVADVYLDGGLIGKTPVVNYRVMVEPEKPKDLELKFIKAGYESHEVMVRWTDIRDSIRLHVPEVKLTPVVGVTPQKDREFAVNARVMIIFAALIAISATLIMIKLRRRPDHN